MRYLILLLLLMTVNTAGQSALRPLAPADLLTIEDIGQTASSPDGKWIVYVVKRARSTAVIHHRPFLDGHDRADIWLAPLSGSERPRNITNGAASGSGWWAPTWSPDSRKIAMLSTHGDNVRLWVWDMSSGKSRQLTERGVDPAASSFAWVSNTRLVCAVLPVGHKPNVMTVEMRATELASENWSKALRGREPTASVLQSGVAFSPSERPQGELLLLDVGGPSKLLATGPAFREVRVGEGGRFIAALKQGSFSPPDPSRPVVHMRQPWIYEAVIVAADGKALTAFTDLRSHVQPGTLRWSPDGQRLAFVRAEAAVSVCSPGEDRCWTESRVVSPTAIVWSTNGKLTVLGHAKADDKRSDWWLARPDAEPIDLTARLKTVPPMLIKGPDNSLFGLSEGDVWRIDLNSNQVTNVTPEFEPRINSILSLNTTEAGPASHVIISSRVGTLGTTPTEWHIVDLTNGTTKQIPKPHADALFSSFTAPYRSLVSGARDSAGTYLWVTDIETGASQAIYRGNEHLKNIVQTDFRKIEYRTAEGRDLKGWILLPVGYESGKKYPAVVVIYPGMMQGDNPPGGHARNINNHSALNFQLLAARGYAVLYPSIPLKPEGETSDPLPEVSKGVLPAVDKMIEIGVADPDRLGAIGQSYGGYGVYGLLAQTKRFKTGVSLAGLSELISLYGTIDARFRYDQNPHERLSGMSLAETGQLRMGSPPWKDPERYIRNSPIFSADKIETPLMIVQGDLDFVAIQQGEQMFSALHRQNKRASFVRYWGEGHVIESPANVQDLWRRIFAWFDEFLGAD